MDWACAKVSASSDMPDGALRAQLDAKLAGRAGIRYAAIATHAQVRPLTLSHTVYTRQYKPCSVFIREGVSDRTIYRSIRYAAIATHAQARPRWSPVTSHEDLPTAASDHLPAGSETK